MGIDFFREFLTLATYRNYTSAAKALNISQPTLSRHIASLEAELGVKLLFEDKPFCLTAAGEAVLRRAGEIVSIYDEVAAEIRPLRGLKPERVVVQDMRHVTPLFLRIDAAQRAMRGERPELSFAVVDPKAGDTPLEMLDSGIDLAFDFRIGGEPAESPGIGDDYGYVRISEFPSLLCFGVPKGHPLESKTDAWLSDFANERFLSPAQQSHASFRDEFAKVCRKAGFNPLFDLVHTNSLIEFYARGSGAGVYIGVEDRERKTPSLVKANLLKNTSIVHLAEKLYVSAFLLYRKSRVTPAFQDFIDRVASLDPHLE